MNNNQKYDWPVLIARQVESGDGVAKFCRANNLNSKSFYNNRSKLGANQTTTTFVKVQTQIRSSQTLRLVLGSNTLEIPMSVEPQWLAVLLRELA
jgi:hypothetical protein